MEALWAALTSKADEGTLKGDDETLFRKLVKAARLLAENPRYPGLQSHEIAPLSQRYGYKVWQSYLENKTPAAGRLFWRYGPPEKTIVILGVEPHPESGKSRGYDRVRLSQAP